jgi:hypothetical protein
MRTDARRFRRSALRRARVPLLVSRTFIRDLRVTGAARLTRRILNRFRAILSLPRAAIVQGSLQLA